MKPIENVNLFDVDYPIFELDTQDDEIGIIRIGTDELNEVIEASLENGDENVWKPARAIDDEIYCFMPLEYLESHDEEWVRAYFHEYYD